MIRPVDKTPDLSDVQRRLEEPMLFEPRIPFDKTAASSVIVYRLKDGRVCSNVSLSCVQHSPTGWECGYYGSGPADLALNILNAFIPPGHDRQEPVKLHRGRCSAEAWRLHQSFKREFIGRMSRDGGSIPTKTIFPAEKCRVYWLGPIRLRVSFAQSSVCRLIQVGTRTTPVYELRCEDEGITDANH